MICPHCHKDMDLIYPGGEYQGRPMSRKEAEGLLETINRSLDSLQRSGAYNSGTIFKTDLERRYDELLHRCNELEVALGY